MLSSKSVLSNTPDYHAFDIKCKWITECTQKNCYLWRIQRAGAWYMCRSNPIADAMYDSWGNANLPKVGISLGSGGPHILCWSFEQGTKEENDNLDKLVELMFKRINDED